MDQKTWTAVDAYFNAHLIGNDPVLDAALVASEEANLPTINVAPNQGKLLHLLARMAGAKRILEIGTLGGYSTTWLARALPDDGQLITLEYEPRHAEVALSNIANAKLADKVEIRIGRAVDTLAAMIAQGTAPFDFIFIDADKPSNPDYLQAALQLSRPGTTIILDNVVRGGAVVNENTPDASVIGVHRFTEMVAAELRLSATAIQTVGSKGYDGFVLLLVGE